EKALEITDAIAGNVMLYDLQQDDLWIVAERGVDKEKKNYRQRLGEGVVGQVARDKRLLNVPDVYKVGWANDYIRLIRGARSELAVPILESEKLWGVINIESPDPDHFGQADEQLLTALADMAVIALQNAERYRKVTTKEAQLIALREVDQRIISQLDNPDQVMRAILEGALILNRAEKGYLHLCEQGVVKTIYVAQANGNGGLISVDKDDVVRGERFRGIVAHVAETQQLYRSSGDAQIDEFHDGDLNMHSVVAVPLTVKVGDNSEELIGVVSLQSLRTNAFDTDTEEVLKMFAAQAVIAIRSARDYDRAEKEVLRFSQLYNTAWELAHITELKKLDKAYDIVMRRADARQESQVIITRYNEDAQELELVRSMRVEGPLHFKHMKVDEGVNGFVARTRETIVLYDTNESEAKLIPLKPTDTPINSLVVTPIEFEENYYGNLALSHEQANYFKGTDVELIRGLAKQLAITIHRLETVQARREAEKRVKEVEVMSSIGQSTFELSHRLGNDLGLVKSYVNNIRSELEASDRTISQVVNDYLKKIVHDVQVVLKLSQQLKMELQEDTKDLLQPEVIPIKELLQEIALCHSNIPTNVAVHLDVDENVEPVKATLDQIKNTLRNLFFNAVEAMPEGGTVTLRARNAGDYVEIEVEDTGMGISPERQGRIFDLFYSTKGSSGFGLWSARRYALENGGDLSVESQPGKGATFRLLLPAAKSE
ncbi:MAG TPA: GAF domain-containing protein, partial [Nitrososphaera sp.]|nr:GAF domain-containing protein [Nitrososphaera sp.]